jgi:hypothetical protein
MTATIEKFSLNFVRISYHHIRTTTTTTTTTKLTIFKIDQKINMEGTQNCKMGETFSLGH